MLLIMNRAYQLIPSLINSIDCILAESLLTTTQQCCSGYKWNPPSEVALQLSLLAPALHREANVPILSLDYWSPDDAEAVREIYRRERLLGHHPYVATPMLDRIYPEPPA
jgi:hypothetical protein